MVWLTWRSTGWVGPQLPPFGGFLGWKIDFQTDADTFTTELWVIWGQKITLLDASVGLDLILLQAGIKQRGCSCGLKTVSHFSEQWVWRENKVTWLQLASELNRCLVERSDQVSMKATDYTLKSLFCLKDQETTPMVRQSQEKHNRLDWTHHNLNKSRAKSRPTTEVQSLFTDVVTLDHLSSTIPLALSGRIHCKEVRSELEAGSDKVKSPIWNIWPYRGLFWIQLVFLSFNEEDESK